MTNNASDVTASFRIRELAVINEDVSVMLASAGKAVNALTRRSLDFEDTKMHSTNAAGDDASHRVAFEENAKAYYETLQAICARLNRQAYALEEAGIVTAEAPILTLSDVRKGATTGGSPVGASVSKEDERVKNGGLGNFDVGWLNSRGNKVGAEMEAETMSKVKALCEEWKAAEHPE